MKLIDKLPYFYDNGYTRPIIEAEQVEADILYREIAETLKQCFVETATWGLDYWEEMLFLPKGTGRTYDERRSIIYARMRATRTTTVEVIKELAVAFFGSKNIIVTEHNSNYSFNIDCENIFPQMEENFDNSARIGFARVGFARIGHISGKIIKLQDLINTIEIFKPAHLNYDFTFSTKTNVQINSDEKTGYSYLPICNTFKTGTWWKMYADGISNKGKVIQAKSYDGYSYLPICGIYKCIMKIRNDQSINESSVVGIAVVGNAIVREEKSKSQIGMFQIGYSQLL